MIASNYSQQDTWTHTTLNEFCGQRGQSIEPRKTPDSQFELYSVPSFPSRQPEIVFGKKIGSNKQIVASESVLLCKINPRINRAWVVGQFSPHTKIASTEWIVFPPDTRVEPRFLCYFLQQNSVRDFLASNVSGVGGSLMRVKPSTLRDFPFAYPERDEQSSIVAEIEKQFSRLDEAVANLKRVKVNLKRYKAAVLKAAVEGKLTEDWRKQHPNVEPASRLIERILAERRAKWSGRGKYKEPDTLDASGLPLLPNSWEWVSLDQLLLNITDGDHQPPPQTDSGVPFLVIGNVRSGKLEFEDSRFVSRQYADGVDVFRKPTRGDILYTLVGSFGIALSVDTDQEFCIQRHIGILRPHQLSPTSYLVHALNSSLVFDQASKVATGTAQKTVPLSGLRRFPIPLAPQAEQQQVVAEVERRLSVIEEIEVAVEANLTRADRLRQSVLQLAFSGRLKITEGAVELSLLRIAAQPNAPYLSTEEIVMNKRPTTSSRHRRTLLEALEDVDSPVAPEELFSLCGFDSGSIEEVERFYAELNELISANKVEELRPTQDRVTLKVIQ